MDGNGTHIGRLAAIPKRAFGSEAQVGRQERPPTMRTDWRRLDAIVLDLLDAGKAGRIKLGD